MKKIKDKIKGQKKAVSEKAVCGGCRRGKGNRGRETTIRKGHPGSKPF